jgi:ElaB/YqjD/DUF883 family membrane-anchored ribosome-binding protein
MISHRTSPNGARAPHEQADTFADNISDKFKDATEGLQERAGQLAEQALQYAEVAQDAVKEFRPFVRRSLRDNPMKTLASFVLVGFVLGALWKK